MRILVIGTLLVVGLALGCDTGRGPLGAHHGEATRLSREGMVQNPRAGGDHPVEILDPRSAEHVMDNYSRHQEGQQHGGGRDHRGGSVLTGEIQ